MRILYFHNIPLATLQADLQKHFPDRPPEKIDQAIRQSLGKPGRALRLLANPHEFETEKIRYQKIQNILQGQPIHQNFQFVEELIKAASEEGGHAELDHFFENTLNLLRTHLHNALREASDPTPFTHRITAVYRAHNLLNKNINKRLTLEHLLLNF